jgi:hypothetical protein
MLQRGMRANL